MRKLIMKYYVFLQIMLFVVVLLVNCRLLRLLQTELLVREIKTNGIDYDAFRKMQLNKNFLQKAEKKVRRLIKNHPKLKGYSYIDSIGYLTFSMMANDYNVVDSRVPDSELFLRGMAAISGTQSFHELYSYYRAVLADLKIFPVPRVESDDADISYEDTWDVPRSYGGNRRHEGTDLMASNNLRGYFPVISMTDGCIEKMGWLEQGGYRIGIRSEAGGYFYYAHLDSYAPGLKTGDKVIAGQFIGFMGDSGYGKEGTIGMFDVHLHMGIYVRTESGDISVNPYNIMKLLEEKRTVYLAP